MGSRNNKPGRIVKGTAKQPTLKDASGIWSLDEAMQAHRANAWPQPNLFQPVANSLRFKNNTSYVTRQITKPGNQRTFTASLWVKRDTIGTRDGLFNTNNSSGNSYWGFEFGSDDRLYVYDSLSSTLTTTQVFRDTSAWYHIVVAVDTLQSTSSNRTKVYVNGAQVTSFSSAGYPAQGLATRMNGMDVPNQAIGCWIPADGAYHFGGYITEVNVIDGYQLDPTFFGKFDNNNTWVPIPYTGTYGTNGFYLPFTNATTSQTFGYDASLTGTTTYDADQDPYRGSVSLHLTGNGPVGGQNNTFTDSGPYQFAITRSGSTITQGSFSPFPLLTNTPYNPAVHGGSAYFNDTLGDYLLVATDYYNSTNIGSGAFTLECWAWIKSGKAGGTGNGSHVIMSQGNNASNLMWSLQVNFAGTQLIWGLTGGSASVTTTIPLNSWVHFAITRDASNSEKIFVNGVLVNTRSNTSNYSTVARYEIQLGCAYDTNYPGVYGVNSYANTLWGYISSTRLIIGTPVYTAAFTPPNKPFGTLTNNLVQFSEDIANSAWTMANSTVISSAGIAPDGTPSACLVVPNTSSQQHYFNSVHYASTGSTTTLSFYAKASGYGYIQAETPIDGGGYSSNTYDLITGTVVGSQWDSGSLGTATITSAGNGWWRCTLQNTNMSASGNNFYLGIRPTGNTGISSYAGDGVSGIYVWGVQLEISSTATTYTPTPANFRTAPRLLLNFANAAVVDTASAQNLLTASGATITSASKYGSGALTFNGSTDYLNGSVGYTFGSNDWTIEGWINSRSDGNVIRFNQYNIAILVSSGTLVYYITSNGSGWNIASGLSFSTINMTSAGGWYHFALVRNKGAITPYLNGRAGTSCSIGSSAIGGDGGFLRIATEQTGFVGGFGGQLDDVRITQGVARYTTDFTPPARALPEIGGKSFITQNINAGVVRSFTTTGTTSWTAPIDVTRVEVLVVAGGGGSGGVGLRSGMANTSAWGGGGGGGGVIYNSQYPVTPGQTYTVTVGAGGAVDTNGGNSVFGNLTAIGGGAGGDSSNGAVGDPGNAGGSGGGGGGDIATAGGAGTAGQGFAGGAGQDPAPEAGGGGGGAGGAGVAGTSTSAGGVGLQFGISGTPTYYAGGGGGGCGTSTKTTNTGGLGGGGNGTTNPYTGASNATAGTANTGGGGGGGPTAGGSGIVVVRYTTTAVGNTSDATTDNLVDSPTLYGHDTGAGGEVVGNYATFNPLFSNGQTYTLSNGNLTASNPSSWLAVLGTIAVSTGKWYFESYPSDGVWHMTGVDQITRHTSHIGGNSSTKGVALVYDPSDTRGDISYNGGNSVYTGGSNTFNAGDVIGVALDLDNNNIKFYKNNVLQYNLSNILQAGASYTFGVSLYSGGTISGNFGQRAWAYAPPAGFNALTTKNLPRLTNAAAIAPNQYFDAVLYTGSGSARSVSGFNFAPDLLWVKDRSSSAYHRLFDRVRGATNSPSIYSNSTGGEAADNLTFTSNGFSYTTDPYSTGMNVNNNLHVVWGWQAGGAAVANTSGTITSQVSANTTSGFSIVTWTGVTGGVGTIGHGLGTAPKLIITKQRNQTGAWYTYTTAIDGSMDYFLLNTNAAKGDSGLAVPTSTVFSNDGWTGTSNMVAYCWAEVAGFSKFGTYTGNGSADGPFVYLGFTPRFVMVKKTDSADQDWYIWDTTRSSSGGNNALDLKLYPNQTYAENGGAGGGESTSTNNIDAVSNGFKLRSANAASNASGASFIYMAFAGKPFGNVNGTAR